MSYLDVEKQLDNIMENLETELHKSGATDKTGNVINSDKFNQVITAKIGMCHKMLADLEISRNRFDPNTNNIIFARIQALQDMIAAKSLNPSQTQIPSHEDKIIAKTAEKQNSKPNFLGGIKKLFGRAKSANTPSHGRGK